MEKVAGLRIDRRKQHELLAVLADRRLVEQTDRRQVGGGPPTSLPQSPPELLDPRPDRHVRALDAQPAQHLRHAAKTHPTIVQEDRHFDDVAIRPLTLEKANLFKHLIQRGKIQLHQLLSEPNLPNLS